MGVSLSISEGQNHALDNNGILPVCINAVAR